ncbi:MAG TPA: cell wall hydrolase [Methylomirabilota bacterium]|nr:cell wall hydrolase [Methylomirabilota bacterium]
MRKGVHAAQPRQKLQNSAQNSAVATRPPRLLAAGGLLVAAGCGLIGSTVPVDRQDVAGLLLASFETASRWTVTLSEGPGGETRMVTEPMGEITGTATVTVGGGAIVVDGVDPVVTGSLGATAHIPDEERIDRSWKGDLPVTITTPATAPGFSAGSIYPEHSRLAPPDADALPTVAFSTSEVPLSALAVARFISPRAPTTVVAELQPIPTPRTRPNVTALVASSYPSHTLAPAAANAAASAMLAAYAPEASVVDQAMFAALFTTPKFKPKAPAEPRRPGDHWWAKLMLPSEIYSAKEQACLAEAVYFEARSEPYKGQVAVAQVVLNRVRNPAYPDSICAVVYQNRNVRNACQFSFACDGIKDVVRSRKSWSLAKKVARDVSFEGVRVDEVGTATHYHATYVRPNWASIFKKKARIGLHVFYQTIYGGWS